ncbi:helix-turn-helix domain-containing protein [Methylobacterium brachythecii]|nr:helix-turn-helix domain-containing protein [Methylobacterium brachythecii]
MTIEEKDAEVVRFPKEAKRPPSSVERIWGKSVTRHGYAGVPSILIRAQKRLGLSPIQLNIVIQLLDYWHDPARKPFPPKKELAERIGVTPKTVQNNIRELEKAGLITRHIRRTSSGDYNSNIYDLNPLVDRVRSMEPEFEAARVARDRARKAAETPVGLRSA